MALFDGLAKRLGYVKAQLNSAPAWLQAESSAQFTIPDRSLPEAQLELYQRLSWVQIAVAASSKMAATTKFNVMALQGEKRKNIDNHEFELRMMRPNPLQSRSEFLVSTFSFLALTGNAYWWLNRSNEKAAPDEIWIIPSNKIKPVPDKKLFIKGYVYEPDAGTEVALEPHEIVHFREWHPLNPYVGLSPIESFAVDAEGEMAMAKWNTNLFGKDNAKVPGALAFADPIDDATWARMKDEIKREHGGTKRSLMMMRNVGQGGVQWVQMAMSQNDMQFLQGRTFTKEEIYSIYAPGLASMLAVNATEANSVAGKATFIGMGVWPKLVHVAEKITNDILPAYGANLVGEFEDIRPSDRMLELQEQAAAERVMTVDEIREMFYEAPSIGDERGKLTITELQRYTSTPPEPPQMPQQQQPNGQQQNVNENDAQDPQHNEAQQQHDQNQQVNQQEQKPQSDSAKALKASQIKAHTSVMVAFYMPPRIAVQLSDLQKLLPSSAEVVPVSELHLTLDIIGKATDYDESQLNALRSTIESFLSARPPLIGRLNGVGRFHNAEFNETDVIYASFDSAALPEFRQSLVESLRSAGFESSTDYGYQPHVTLGYIPPESVTPMLAIPKDEMFFGELYLSIGGVSERFMFGVSDTTYEPQKPDSQQAKRAEVKAFKAWLKKRPNADIHAFKADFLTHEELHEIAEEVREVATEQPPFELPTAFTRDSVKALILQLDPNGEDDNAELRIRDELERRTTRAIDKAFTEMVNTLFPEGYDSYGGAFLDPNLEADRIHRRFMADQALKDAVSRALQDSVDLGVNVAVATLESVSFGFDWTLASAPAREWALQYTDELLAQMGTTTRKVVGVALERWVGNGENLDSLIADLEPIFGKKRAEMISITEVTRAFHQGNTIAYKESGVVSKVAWKTVRDEIVSRCPICAPMEGRYAELGKPWIHPNGKEITIPGHVRCRCWSVPVIE